MQCSGSSTLAEPPSATAAPTTMSRSRWRNPAGIHELRLLRVVLLVNMQHNTRCCNMIHSSSERQPQAGPQLHYCDIPNIKHKFKSQLSMSPGADRWAAVLCTNTLSSKLILCGGVAQTESLKLARAEGRGERGEVSSESEYYSCACTVVL